MSVTIVDVANKCGVSKATVSRAFISPQSVKEETRKIIYSAAKELNYSPNTIARALVRQRTENIAFIIHEKQYPVILNPFYAPVLEAVIREASKNKYSVFIASDHDVHLPNGYSYIRKHMDGVIFAGDITDNIVYDMLNQKLPVVLLNKVMNIDGLVCVTAAHFSGAALATQYLVDRGHRDIGLLSGHFSKQVTEARYNGYCSVMEANSLSINKEFVLDIDPIMDVAEATFTQLLKKDNRPTAFFCTNDIIAAGAVKAALRARLRVPEDVAIVGFDDSIISSTIMPELTTIHVDTAEMGRLAMSKLLTMIDNKPLDTNKFILPTSLIVRHSA